MTSYLVALGAGLAVTAAALLPVFLILLYDWRKAAE